MRTDFGQRLLEFGAPFLGGLPVPQLAQRAVEVPPFEALEQHAQRALDLGERDAVPKGNVAVQMDPIDKINIRGDSTFALLLEAQKRGHRLSYYTPDKLAQRGDKVFATVHPLEVRDQAGSHFTLGDAKRTELTAFDVILLRQDPPFDMAYITTTHLLERILAEAELVDEGARRVYFSTAPGTSVYAPQHPTVHALDLETGATRWVAATPHSASPTSGWLITKSRIFVSRHTQLDVFERATGKHLGYVGWR